jgi:hypothetical protein
MRKQRAIRLIHQENILRRAGLWIAQARQRPYRDSVVAAFNIKESWGAATLAALLSSVDHGQ